MTKVTLLALSASLGCSFIARGPDQYRDDTAAALAPRSSQIKACYDSQLAAGNNAAGEVTVNFTVEKKTGNFINAEVDPSRTTAPDALASCVLTALEGLQLAPEDQRDGQATFTWVFSINAAAAG